MGSSWVRWFGQLDDESHALSTIHLQPYIHTRQVASAPDLRTGLSMLLQLTGLGSLRPNTLVLAWPDARRITHERALRFLEFIARAAVNEKAVVALKTWGPHFQPFPTSNQVMRGSLDVWYVRGDLAGVDSI